MGLDALSTATAGLRLTQAQIGIVSQNVANAGTVGYVRRRLDAVTSGTGNSGVAAGTIQRTLDQAALKQMRLETSGAAYTSLNASVRTTLDGLYGVPGTSTSLDGTLNSFVSSLQTLMADPTASTQRSTVVDAARTLAARIGSAATGVQDLRSGMEAQLAEDTQSASNLLSTIADLNVKISGTQDDAGRADLLDRRDQAVNALSALTDLQVVQQSQGSISVLTGSGVTLVEGGRAATLSFDSRGQLSPDATFSTDPAKRGVGTIIARTLGGATIDLVADRAFRSGSIAAALEARDEILPQAQRQLDDLAAGLSRAMSDQVVTGRAVSDGGRSGVDIDLTKLSAGNAIEITVKDASGTPRNLVLVPSYESPPPTVPPGQTNDANAQVVSFTIPRPSDTRDPAAIRTALASALGANYAVSATPGGSAGSVRITTTGTPQILTASASITQSEAVTETRNGSAQVSLFVDAGRGNGAFTGSFDGGSQLTGFAQRITVNPAVATNSNSLVAMSTTTPPGDNTRPKALYDALTSVGRTFSSTSAVGGVNAPYSTTVMGFAQGVIADQGAAAASAKDLDEGQNIALVTAQSRFANQAGVNIDEEMSKLIELQTAYTANARVLTAARDMLDMLLRI